MGLIKPGPAPQLRRPRRPAQLTASARSKLVGARIALAEALDRAAVDSEGPVSDP